MNVTTALTRLGQLLAAALILTGSQAYGQFVAITTVDTGTTITQGYNFTNKGAGSNGLSFATFNDMGGTLQLNSVTIVLTGITSTGSATIQNQSDTGAPPGFPETLTGGFTSTYKATSSTSTSDAVSTSIVSGTQDSPGQVAAGGSFTTGTLTGSQSPSPQSFSVADAAQYDSTTSGTATITITLKANTSVDASGDSDSGDVYVGGSASALASGQITLIYAYSAVPEPSKTTACMIGFALCLLVGRNYFKGRDLDLA